MPAHGSQALVKRTDLLGVERPDAASALDRLTRFAETGAVELVRAAARDPLVARHFHRLEPFAPERVRADFADAVLGFTLWWAERLAAAEGGAASGARRLRRLLQRVDGEAARYERLSESYALERFTRRLVAAVDLLPEDRWAARMLLLRNVPEPLRRRVTAAVQELAADARTPTTA